jgi:hypothetical protein
VEIRIFVKDETEAQLVSQTMVVLERYRAQKRAENRAAMGAEFDQRTQDATPVKTESPIETATAPAPAVVANESVEVSDEEIDTKLRAFIDAFGTPAAVSLLSEFGAKRRSEVPTDRRAEFYGRLILS